MSTAVMDARLYASFFLISLNETTSFVAKIKETVGKRMPQI